MGEDELKAFRDRFNPDLRRRGRRKRPSTSRRTSPEVKYLHERREALGGPLPGAPSAPCAGDPEALGSTFEEFLEGQRRARDFDDHGLRADADQVLLRDKEIGKRVVPIVPDEARTFGMEGMFRQLGIYNHVGQLYEPVDSRDQLLYYKRGDQRPDLQEGINEAGAMSSLDRRGHRLRQRTARR
jgi:pyruvate dehydrogenase E1 component